MFRPIERLLAVSVTASSLAGAVYGLAAAGSLVRALSQYMRCLMTPEPINAG